jgi:hypothetical protein
MTEQELMSVQEAFWDWIEEEAAEAEVTVDYYLEEFLVS